MKIITKSILSSILVKRKRVTLNKLRYFNLFKKSDIKFSRFELSFNMMRTIEDGKKSYLALPFRVTIRGTKNNIEEKVLKKWSNLFPKHPYSLEELKQFQFMKRFILNNIQDYDIASVLFELYKKKWMRPFNSQNGLKNFCFIDIGDVDVNTWQLNKPYTEISGNFIFNIKEFFDELEKQKIIKIIVLRKFNKIVFKINFGSKLPLFAMKTTSSFMYEMLEKYIYNSIKDKNSKMGKEFRKLLDRKSRKHANKIFEKAKIISIWKSNTLEILFDKIEITLLEKLAKYKWQILLAAIVLAGKRKKNVQKIRKRNVQKNNKKINKF